MPKTSVDISKEAMASINRWVARRGGRGMRKYALSKLIEWFGEQPDSFKSIVTGMVDEDMRTAYANALRSLADQLDPYTDRVSHPDQGPAAGGSEASHGEQHGKA